MIQILKTIWHFPRNIAIAFIELYQKTLSPDHSKIMKPLFPSGHCRFCPTCSDYGKLALKKHGFIHGTLKTFWRILRCNPWGKGGEDLT